MNKVIGIGTTLHKFIDTNGNSVYLPCILYHLPETDVRLFSPQTYHQIHGGYSEVYGQSNQMKLHTSTIAIGISRDPTNLPVVFDSFVTGKAKWALESINAWEVVEREDDMKVINSTWAFKCKRYSDGLIKKFKARFCARGDQQLHGIDFFEIYAPVVQWTTI